jgi:hypothetical protein
MTFTIAGLFLVAQTLSIAGCSVLFARAGWGITGQAMAMAIGDR